MCSSGEMGAGVACCSAAVVTVRRSGAATAATITLLLYREMVQPWPWASAVLESECDCFPEVVPVKGEEKKWQEV